MHAMATTLEFFFDCSSPWTYLAFERIQPLATSHDIVVDWRPILVGGVFNAVNPSVYQSREHPDPAKTDHMAKDMQDWARYVGIKITWRPTVFPVNSVKAMRACIAAAEDGKQVALARAVFEAYWGGDQDISLDGVLRPLFLRAGLDADRMFQRIAGNEIKAALKANTDDLIARGGYGSPTIFVDKTDMYFGNDRMPLIEAALERSRKAA
jgi:2-hydroxychromene-2-carboxylate isomerase